MPTDSRTQPRIQCPSYIERFTEKQFQMLLVESAQLLGWHVTAFRNMIGNPEGYPDLTLFRGPEYRLFELKSGKGVLSGIQIHWHAEAAANGVTVHVLRPTEADWERAMDLLAPTTDNVAG